MTRDEGILEASPGEWMATGRLSGTDRSPPRFPLTCCKGREAVVQPLWVIPRGRICQDAPPSFTTERRRRQATQRTEICSSDDEMIVAFVQAPADTKRAGW